MHAAEIYLNEWNHTDFCSLTYTTISCSQLFQAPEDEVKMQGVEVVDVKVSCQFIGPERPFSVAINRLITTNSIDNPEMLSRLKDPQRIFFFQRMFKKFAFAQVR